MDPEIVKRVLQSFRDDKPMQPGSQTGRQTSAPASGMSTLKD